MNNNTITINPPKAFSGDRVLVHNYRKKKKHPDGHMIDANLWEFGKVTSVSSGWDRDREGNISVRHSYNIQLERTVPHKRWKGEVSYLFLTVNDNGLQTEFGE